MRLKDWLIGENNTIDKAKKIIKNNKLTLLEKYLLIKKMYIEYFNYHIEYEAKSNLYDFRYDEIFSKNGNLKACNYKKLLNYEYENLAYNNVVSLCKQFDELVAQGLDIKLLISSKETFATDVLDIKKKFGFGKNYHSNKFETDIKYRETVVAELNKFIVKRNNLKKEEDLVF